MSWLYLDDGFAEHNKVIGLKDKAFRLHVAGLCHCARQLTDGHINETALKLLGVLISAPPKRWADQLVTARLWQPDDFGNGYWIVNYLDWNPSAADVKAKRERNARRQRAHYQRQQQIRSTIAETLEPHEIPNALGDASPNGVTHAATNAAPSQALTPERLLRALPLPSYDDGHDAYASGGNLHQLLQVCGGTADAQTKLQRASHDSTEADIVAALEAARGPGVRDRLAVALSTLAKRRAERRGAMKPRAAMEGA